MKKEVRREDNPAIMEYRYYCDICEKEIRYPASAYNSTICYCEKDNADLMDRIRDMLYCHICNECIRDRVIPIVREMGVRAEKANDDGE